MTCIIKNAIIDKYNWKEDNLIYKGPVDKSGNFGFPLLSKGFFNMECNYTNEEKDYNNLYKRYIDAWNYNESLNIENIEELSPNKTIFLLSRNQDSPNLFHGMSELLNAYVIMHLLNIKSSNIQVLFLDSMLFKDDPLYYFYKNIISNGTEPLFIRNLRKRFYKISSGIHIPYMWDSPCFSSHEILKHTNIFMMK